jgi:hypothetical protein
MHKAMLQAGAGHMIEGTFIVGSLLSPLPSVTHFFGAFACTSCKKYA